MKRVALFSVTYHPFIGGAEVAIKEVTDRLPDWQFDLFTAKLDPKLPHQQRIGRAMVYRLGTGEPRLDKWLYPWRASRLALELHRHNPYDLAHAVLETYAGLGALLFKKKSPRVPYILTLQSGDADSFLRKRTWFWYPIYRKLYTKADKITAISRFLAERAQRFGHKGRIEIIPNGVDISRFGGRMDKDERAFIRRSWGVSEGSFVVVTASRLVHKNGIDTLIESLRYLPKEVVLVIAGSGDDETKLKLLITNYQLQNRVIFLGYIDHDSLPRVLKAADVFARPSRSEGLGNAFLEAMASRLPVIGTPVGGIVDFIKDGETGLLVGPEDPEGLAEAINRLDRDSSLRGTLSRNGRALAKDKYAWDNIAAAYKNIYESF